MWFSDDSGTFQQFVTVPLDFNQADTFGLSITQTLHYSIGPYST